jgi:hypothetical protein
MALLVLGLQQSTAWGWGSGATIGSMIVAVVLLAAVVGIEQRTPQPLIDVRALAANRAFALDNLLTMFVFFTWLAVFFFGSMYFQISVHQEPTQAGFSILTMFYSFFIASRVGGGMMDRVGAKHPVTLGLLATAVGLGLWASELSSLSHGGTLAGMLVTGAGFGLAMSALNTDALNALRRRCAARHPESFRRFGTSAPRSGWRFSGRSCSAWSGRT